MNDPKDSSLVFEDAAETLHFFPFGPFGESYVLPFDQLQRGIAFIGHYIVWGFLSLFLVQYFLGFHWTGSFLVAYVALYFGRMKVLSMAGKKSGLSINLEEISLKLVELETIPRLLGFNLVCVLYMLWAVYSVITDWPIPWSFLISDLLSFVIGLALFTYSTLLLYLKGQSL